MSMAIPVDTAADIKRRALEEAGLPAGPSGDPRDREDWLASHGSTWRIPAAARVTAAPVNAPMAAPTAPGVKPPDREPKRDGAPAFGAGVKQATDAERAPTPLHRAAPAVDAGGGGFDARDAAGLGLDALGAFANAFSGRDEPYRGAYMPSKRREQARADALRQESEARAERLEDRGFAAQDRQRAIDREARDEARASEAASIADKKRAEAEDPTSAQNRRLQKFYAKVLTEKGEPTAPEDLDWLTTADWEKYGGDLAKARLESLRRDREREADSALQTQRDAAAMERAKVMAGRAAAGRDPGDPGGPRGYNAPGGIGDFDRE